MSVNAGMKGAACSLSLSVSPGLEKILYVQPHYVTYVTVVAVCEYSNAFLANDLSYRDVHTQAPTHWEIS